MGERIIDHGPSERPNDNQARELQREHPANAPRLGNDGPPEAGALPPDATRKQPVAENRAPAPKDEFVSASPSPVDPEIRAIPEHANAAKAPERAAADAAAAPEVIEGSAALETAGTFEPKSILKKGGGKIEVNTAAKDVTTRQAETAKPEDKKPVSVYEKFADKSLAPEEAKKKFDDSANPGFFKDLGSRFKDFNKQSFLEKAKELALPALGIAALVAVSGPLGLMVALGAIGYKMYQSREISKTVDLSDGQRDALARRLAQGTQQTPEAVRTQIDQLADSNGGKVTLDNVRNSFVSQPIAEKAPATVVAVGTVQVKKRVSFAGDPLISEKGEKYDAERLLISQAHAAATSKNFVGEPAEAYAQAYLKKINETTAAEAAVAGAAAGQANRDDFLIKKRAASAEAAVARANAAKAAKVNKASGAE